MWLRQVTRGGVYSLAFSSDSATLYTGDGGGWVSAWNRASGQQRKLFQLRGEQHYGSDIQRLAVAKSGQLILAASHRLFKVWDAGTEAFWPMAPALASNYDFALASDNCTLAAAIKGNRSSVRSSIVFSDLERRCPHPSRPAIQTIDMVTDLLFSPVDGTLAVVDMNGGLYLAEPDAEQPIRINGDDEELRIGFSDLCCCLAFSADGKTLAVASDRSILFWDMETRQLRRKINTGRAFVRQLAFHPNGKILASGGNTPLVTLWDVATGKELQRFDWNIGGRILSLAFAPDGMTAAAGGSNRKFVVWDID